MKAFTIKSGIVGSLFFLTMGTSCNVEPTFYSQVVPETFYSSQEAVWERFNRPFTHWRWWIAQVTSYAKGEGSLSYIGDRTGTFNCTDNMNYTFNWHPSEEDK